MFKEYILANQNGIPAAQQMKYGIDLMKIITYTRDPINNRTTITGNGVSASLTMTPDEHETFLTNLKTANRLKSAYE
jgi:hypothetical protein